jgi:4-hydroxy-4-methyl-2-oxoglutarate aldolase
VSIDALQTALLSDAAGRPIAMAGRIRPVWRGARLAGPALTVRTEPGEHPAVLRALEEAQAGVVIVVDGGCYLHRALWGGRLSSLASARGVAGVVIDGAVRDLAEIEELRFPVFAAGVVPTPPIREGGGGGETGTSIVCGGIAVSPGDLVVGDEDGVVVVARDEVDELVTRARELDAVERRWPPPRKK